MRFIIYFLLASFLQGYFCLAVVSNKKLTHIHNNLSNHDNNSNNYNDSSAKNKNNFAFSSKRRFENPWMLHARGGGAELNDDDVLDVSFEVTNGSSSTATTPFLQQNNKAGNVSSLAFDGISQVEREVVFDREDVPTQPSVELPDDPSYPQPKYGLIFMDCFCPYHGIYLIETAKRVYGVGIVNVLSGYIATGMYLNDGIREHLPARVPDIGQEQAWADKIPFKVLNIYCESDAGLQSAERLGVALKLRDFINPASRHKFLMNAAAKASKLMTVDQKMCSTVEEALAFATELGVRENVVLNVSNKATQSEPIRCIVKPSRGVASDGVHLCSSLKEVQEAFEKVYKAPVYGSPEDKYEEVLVQEFAIGQEYAVDIVSKNGEHKVAALWKYDKRPCNGAPFVYHSTMLADANDVVGNAVCHYAIDSLKALDIKWGLSHVEVILDSNLQGRLVEVNCRQHNTDFAPMTSLCIGYNALDMLLAAYLGDIPDIDLPEMFKEERLRWSELPDFPTPNLLGAVIHLVSHAEGPILDIRHAEEIETLQSVQLLHIYPHFMVGNYAEKTIDIRSDAGFVHLINEDRDAFYEDYEKIVKAMPNMFLVDENGYNDGRQQNVGH